MRAHIGTAFAAAVVLGLAGCGGGGGGGGGGGVLPIGVIPTPTPTPTAPAAAELKLTVEIAGSIATPDGSGTYSVLPGQEVVVKSSDSVAWAASGGGGTATLTNDVDTGATQWVSRFANSSKTNAASYNLVASASEGRTKQVNFAVQTGSYDNGDYMVFAANGSRQKLHIDFDAKTYDVTDAVGDKTSGTFTANGTGWVFANSRITGVNNATFLTLKDSFAGGFPFAVPFSSPVAYKNAPFIATRAFVTTQAKLDGTYDRARIEISSTDRDSAIAQIQISGGGTVMKQCVDQNIFRIENCPGASMVTSTVAADAEAGMWALKDPTNGSLLGKFAIATVDGEKIYLSAGTSPATAAQVMAIGVPAVATYADFNASGWATDGDINLSTVSPGLYSLSAPAGPVITKSLALNAMISDAPAGMRVAVDGAAPSDQYLAMRSSKLDLLIGNRGPSSPTRGYLHLGVIQ